MRSFFSIAAILAGLAAVGTAGYQWLFRRPQPMTDGQVGLAELNSRVEIIRDRWAIPHIFAEDEDDLFFAQGYIHAQDRLWQMDFNRRLASGRLSEVVGELTLPLDRWTRVFGLRRSAEATWQYTDPDARRAAMRYAAGVNAVIDARAAASNWPLEFRLLRYRPERWTPVDSLVLLRLMALGLSVNFEVELVRDGLLALLGPERAAELIPAYPAISPLIAAPGFEAPRRVLPPTLALSEACPEQCHPEERRTDPELAKEWVEGLGGPGGVAGQGSNSWVLAGCRTASGAPLLANDPHLLLGLPSIWYENHLDGPQTQVAGVSLPGVPGVIIGHNAEVAWGITAGFSDVQDLYVETRHPDDPLRFRWGDQWLPAEVLEERIPVRGRSRPVAQRVIITRHGPLISELLPEEPRDLALRWTIYEPDNTLGCLLALNRAHTWEAFRAAVADLGAPQLNLSYADRAGNIGWIHAGRIPIRATFQPSNPQPGTLPPGVVPADGASGKEEWLGYIPLDELPQAYNPPGGYIVHANNKPVGEDYPHWLGLDFLPGFRARRIVELIEARATHDIESIATIQLDQVSIPSRTVAQAVAALPAESLDPDVRPLQARLATWDGRMAADSVEAALAFSLLLRLRHLLVSDKLGRYPAAFQGTGGAGAPGLGSLPITGLSPLAWTSLAWTLARLEEPESPWWEQRGCPVSPTPRDDALRLALRQVADDLQARFGPAVEGWQWGRLNQVVVGHPLAPERKTEDGRMQRSPLHRLLNRGPFPMGGDPFTVWPNAFQTLPTRADMVAVSTSWRFIADLSDWDRCRTALPGGQSGLPGSAHYADGLDDWRAGRYHPLLWTRPSIEAAAAARLVLLKG